MATRTSVQSGPWSDAATWGAAAPGVGDLAVITGGHSVWIDGDITVGDGSASTATPAIKVYGDLLWRNQVGDAAANWTLTLNGWLYFSSDTTDPLQSSGRWFIGSSGVHTVGPTTVSVGPIPNTRTATVYFNLAANYHDIYILKANATHAGQPAFYFYGTQKGFDVAPSTSGTVDSASDKISFVDSTLTGADDLWRGAWLEITGGTNLGECREITAYNSVTDTLSWSQYEPMPVACDNTTTYTLVHNYQRAYLTNHISVSGAGKAMTVDRPVNWTIGQRVAISAGANQSAAQVGYRGEVATIDGKVDEKTYTVNCSWLHDVGNFVTVMDRNIVFNSTVPAGAGAARGFRFNLAAGVATTIPTFVFSWCQFRNCGYSGALIYTQQIPNFPTIQNCSVEGQLYNGNASVTGPVVFLGGISSCMPATAYQLDNIHCAMVRGILNMQNDWQSVVSGDTVEKQKAALFRDLTITSTDGGAGYLGACYNSFIYPPTFKNTWYSGITPIATTGGGGCFTGSINIETLRVLCITSGSGIVLVGDSFSVSQPSAGRVIKINNVNMVGINSTYFAIQLAGVGCKATNIYIQNCRMRNWGAGIYLYVAGLADIYLTNNMYDEIKSTTYGALFFGSEEMCCNVYEANSKYGTVVPNVSKNVGMINTYNTRTQGRYVSNNCTYVNPSSLLLGPAQTNAVFNILSYTLVNPQGTWNYLIAPMEHFCVEVANATVNGTPNKFLAVGQGGMIITKEAHPIDPRVNTNIQLKVVPGSSVGQCAVNNRAPITYYKAAGQTITASVYVLKTVSQVTGKRPQLHMFIDGADHVCEMSDVTDTWEQLTLTRTITNNDVAKIWFTCCNNPRYVDSHASSFAGEPLINSVTVYFDELDIS